MAGLVAAASFDRFVPDPLDCAAASATSQSPWALWRPAPFGASRDGPLSPDELEQPLPLTSRSLTPLVADASTAPPASRAGEQLSASRAPVGARYASWTCGAKAVACVALAARTRGNVRGAFVRVAIGRVDPRRCAASALGKDNSPRSRTVLAGEPPWRGVSLVHWFSLASIRSFEVPCSPSRERNARCVGPTRAVSRFVRAPAPRRFPMRHARDACVIGEIACFTAGDIALAGTHAVSATDAWSDATRAGRAAGISVASRPVRTLTRPRGRTGCRDRGLCGRVNAVLPPTIRNAFHRSGALAPRRPFGRPAKASCEPRGLATPRPTVDAFGAGEPCGTPALDPRSRTSLPRRSRFSGSRRRPSTSATVTTRGHTRRARSNLARERRFRAAHVRHQRMPVASATPLRCRSRAPASRDPYATTCVRCVPLDVERGSRVEVCEEVRRAVERRCAPPFLAYPSTRVTGTARRELWICFATCRTGQDSSRRPPRERTVRRRIEVLSPCRNPYANAGGFDRLGARPDRSPVTPPPQRHCSRVSHAFVATPERLPLTRQAREEARSAAP